MKTSTVFIYLAAIVAWGVVYYFYLVYRIRTKSRHVPRGDLKDTIKIVSIKINTILSYIFFATLILVVIALLSYDIYTQIYPWGTGWEWFANTDNLLEGLFLILSIYCVFSFLQQFKINIYSLKMEKEHFSYGFLLVKTIPYSAISKIIIANYPPRGWQEMQLLKIFLDNNKKIQFRLDHLNINRYDDVIRARKPYYLKGLENEKLIIDFLEAKTGKPIEIVAAAKDLF